MTMSGLASSRSTAPVRLSSVVLKGVMAVSGLIWLGFLIGHLGTNLHLFGGAASLNEYYAGLKSNAVLFWGVRAVLVASIVGHVVAAYLLARRSLEARPVAYRSRARQASTWAGLTMRWTGPLLGVFILFHLAHFTTGQAMPPGTTFVEGDDYGNIVNSFSIWYVALLYVIALAALGFHLGHGVWAATLSLGARHPRWNAPLRAALIGLAMLTVLGMVAIPLAVFAGLVH